METRWRGVVLGTALVVVGGLAAADAWCAVEEPPVASSQIGQTLVQDLRRAADSQDWEAVDRSLAELEQRLDASDPAAERSRVRSRHQERRRLRVRHELRLEPPHGHPGETWEEHWEHFGERMGRHWGQFGERMGERGAAFGERMGEHWGEFGNRTGERWGEFGERAGERWGEFGNRAGERWGSFGERTGRRFGRVGDEIGEHFGEVGGDLPDVIELSIETAIDAVETLIDSLDHR
jgi:hypothetical protein